MKLKMKGRGWLELDQGHPLDAYDRVLLLQFRFQNVNAMPPNADFTKGLFYILYEYPKLKSWQKENIDTRNEIDNRLIKTDIVTKHLIQKIDEIKKQGMKTIREDNRQIENVLQIFRMCDLTSGLLNQVFVVGVKNMEATLLDHHFIGSMPDDEAGFYNTIKQMITDAIVSNRTYDTSYIESLLSGGAPSYVTVLGRKRKVIYKAFVKVNGKEVLLKDIQKK